MNQTGYSGLVDGPRRWHFLADLMLEQGYKTFVEVGCKEGRTTGFILKNVPDSRVIAIDPWMAQEKSADPTKETYEKWDFEDIERQFRKNVEQDSWTGPRLYMRVETSEQTAKFLEDTPGFLAEGAFGPIDMVFIDALHDYEHVKQDIELWWPKVRSGGILAGHDFNHKWPGVERAFAEAFNLMQVGVGPDSVAFVVKP